jgi:hypothetical protein
MLSCFAPLAAIDGVRLISLMKNQDAIEVEAEDGRFVIEGLGDDFDSGADSFLDCAARMEYVDIIVTSSTAIAHLARALGKPIFLALKHVPDWRWLMHRDDCPWYPTMRLFRQTEKGDWKSVFDRIASSVEACLSKDRKLTDKRRHMGALAIPGAAGELIDKVTTLEIKEGYIKEAAKLDNIRLELTLLRELRPRAATGVNGWRNSWPNSRQPIVCSGTSKIPFENMKREAISALASSRWHAKFTRLTTRGPLLKKGLMHS